MGASAAEVAATARGTTPLVACTASRDVRAFPQLIEQMHAALGDAWHDLSLSDALAFLDAPDVPPLEFVALAVGREDEGDLDLVSRIMARAEAVGTAVIIVAAEVSPRALHALLKLGAHGFVPYPLPEGELAAAIARLPPPGGHQAETPVALARPTGAGTLTAVHALAGGVGGTTLAVNLAWELANLPERPRVCLIDLDLQFGAVATYLDLPHKDAITELYADIDTAEMEAFRQALATCRDRLQVLCSPADMLPLDIVNSDGIEKLIGLARKHFDHVVIDMPRTVAEWTGTVLETAQSYLILLALDMRSAENALRMLRAVMAEDLPQTGIRWALGRAPGRLDIAGRDRQRRLASNLGIEITLPLEDGGRAVTEACETGVPLSEVASRNALRRRIAKLAADLHHAAASERAGQATG